MYVCMYTGLDEQGNNPYCVYVHAGLHAGLHSDQHAGQHAGLYAGPHANLHAGSHAGPHANLHAGPCAGLHAGQHAGLHAGLHADMTVASSTPTLTESVIFTGRYSVAPSKALVSPIMSFMLFRRENLTLLFSTTGLDGGGGGR